MNNQVLSINQCRELVALGLDMSDASMCYIWMSQDSADRYLIPNNDEGLKDTIIYSIVDNLGVSEKDINVMPTFTLQDILDKLPQGFYLEKNTTSLDKKVFLQINKTAGGGYNIAYEQYWDENGKLKIKMYGRQLAESLLEAAFNMLKWGIENKYI